MSLNLVNGFEDIISRYNLVANGNFRINQRGNFSSFSAAKVNDYIADCWYISSASSIDYVEALHDSAGLIGIKGRGKKNQSLRLTNKNYTPPLGYGSGNYADTDGHGRTVLTGSVVARIQSNSVPFRVSCAPRYNTSQDVNLFSYSPVCRYGQGTGYNNQYFQPVLVKKTKGFSVDSRPFIQLILEADGEFEAYFYNFRELAGAFRNPPTDVFVPYAEDLQRCERYYQVSAPAGSSEPKDYCPMRLSGSNLQINRYVPFRTLMAGTPSVTVSLSTIDLYQDSADGNGSTGGDQANWSPASSRISSRGFTFTATRSGSIANRSLAYPQFNWTAEIA